MLQELHVADVGIVDDVTVVLGAGLTAITGETGAGKTLLVEGLIINRSRGRKAIPAIEATLRDGGATLYSWTIEPTAANLAAGATIGFRSIVAPPRPGSGEVALRFVPRRDLVIGMR